MLGCGGKSQEPLVIFALSQVLAWQADERLPNSFSGASVSAIWGQNEACITLLYEGLEAL